MIEAVTAIIARLGSRDRAEGDRANLVVRLLLEMNVRPAIPANDPDFYITEVPDELRERPLREDEERFIVAGLAEALHDAAARGDDHRAVGILWALGATHPWTGGDALMRFIKLRGIDASEAVIHQAIFAFDNYLFSWGPDHPRFAEFVVIAVRNDVRSVLEVVASRPWQDPFVARDAHRVLTKVNALLPTVG